MDKNASDKSPGTQHPGSGVSRRNFITTGALAGAVLAAPLSWTAFAQPVSGAARSTMKSVSFKHGNIAMAGNLYLPEGFSEAQAVPRDRQRSSRRRREGTDGRPVCAAAGGARVCHPGVRRVPSGRERRRAPLPRRSDEAGRRTSTAPWIT